MPNKKKKKSIPILTSSEVEIIEPSLGEGGFCTVSAVRRLTIDPSHTELLHPNIGLALSTNERESRSNFSKRFDSYYESHHAHRNIVRPGDGPPPADPTVQKPPRVALKSVKPYLNRKRYKTGVNDLMAEVEVLSKMNHANIIGLYAVGYDEYHNTNTTANTNTNTKGSKSKKDRPPISFVLIDQLRSTLPNRIYKWREDRGIGVFQTNRSMKESWLERMVVISKLADAVMYLHDRGWMHRDVNPGNIGFGEDDVVKLFDFGLAKCIHKIDDKDNIDIDTDTDTIGESTDDGSNSNNSNNNNSNSNNDVNKHFDLTGNTGTLRYMAPEVALSKPYGQKVDVFSLALVMYEILSLTKPYVKVKPEKFHEEVIGGGMRPELDESWPESIRYLLERMWDGDSTRRPSSKQVVQSLGYILRGEDLQLYPRTKLQGWAHRLKGGK